VRKGFSLSRVALVVSKMGENRTKIRGDERQRCFRPVCVRASTKPPRKKKILFVRLAVAYLNLGLCVVIFAKIALTRQRCNECSFEEHSTISRARNAQNDRARIAERVSEPVIISSDELIMTLWRLPRVITATHGSASVQLNALLIV